MKIDPVIFFAKAGKEIARIFFNLFARDLFFLLKNVDTAAGCRVIKRGHYRFETVQLATHT